MTKRGRWRGPVPHLLLLLAALPVAYFGMLTALQRLMIFPRFVARAAPDAGAGVDGLERLWIDSPEGRVEAWLLPGAGVSAETPGPAVVFAHGNGELIEQWTDEMARYRRVGMSVLLVEYRGYGRSEGSPSQAAITEDFVRFYDLLVARPEVDAARVIFHGRSLGGGAVCALAAKRPPAALVLQSTFTSVAAIARRYLMPRALVRDPFDNLAVLATLRVPVLLMHGRDDRVIPFAHAQKLQAAAPGSELISYPGGHNDTPRNWDDFFGRVTAFLRRAKILTRA